MNEIQINLLKDYILEDLEKTRKSDISAKEKAELEISALRALVELAKRMGVSKQTLYKYENNAVTNIPSDKIQVAAQILDISPSYLMGWEDNLSTDNADIIPDLMSDKELLDSVKKLIRLNKEHQQTIFDNIAYWYEKEGR
jgi:transcriptional regulator with XRE-family HTH domain